jgi:hypothetical protein
MKEPSNGPGSIVDSVILLRQIQEQMRDICQPHYHEFHKVTTEHGFTKITIPGKRARSAAKTG